MLPVCALSLTAEATTISYNLALGEPVDQFIFPLLTSVDKFCLQMVHILTGFLTEAKHPNLFHVPLYNYKIAVYASEVIYYSFSVYVFNSGHFTFTHASEIFHVAIAANTRQCGRALFNQITGCPVISESADDLLRCINASSAKSIIHG